MCCSEFSLPHMMPAIDPQESDGSVGGENMVPRRDHSDEAKCRPNNHEQDDTNRPSVFHGTVDSPVTSKPNIIPECRCSAMWQWAIQLPGLLISTRMSMVDPTGTMTVSFQAMF